MPRRDGTGPMGQGSMTGKGFGNCLSWGIPALAGAAMAFGFGRGRGFGRGFARGFGFGSPSKKEELTALKEQAKSIQNRISELENQ
jgi:hypothetical protein